MTFRLPEESTSPESTHPFQPLENTIENFPPPDDPEPDDTDRNSEFDLILEDPLEPEDDFALHLMSALYKKSKSQLVMIPVEINGTSVTALIDSGAQRIFVSKSVAKTLKGVSYDPSSSVTQMDRFLKEFRNCFALYLSDLTSSYNAHSEEERECCSLDIVS